MKKVVVVRFSSLGDIALTAPVYRNIKEHISGVRVYALTKRAYMGLLEENPYVDEIIVVEDYKNIFSLIKRLNAEKFDYFIDLHNSLRSTILKFFVKAGKKVSYNKDALARRLFVFFRRSSPALEKHTVDRYLGALKKAGIPVKYRDTRLYFKKPEVNLPDKKILFVQTSFLGDIVLSVPALQAIKNKHKNAQLHLLTTPQGLEILKGSSFLDKITVYDKKNKDKSIFSYIKLILQLRREHYDTAVIPHRSFRSALMVRLAGIKERIGFNNSQGKFLLTKVFPFQWSMHDLERNYVLLKPLGIEVSGPENWLTAEGSEQYSRRLLCEYGITPEDTLIGINPGSIWETKKWPSENFAALISKLVIEAGAKIILFGAKNDLYLEEKILWLLTESAKQNVVSLIGKTKLKELMGLIAGCDLFLTNDSGPMHIATALGVTTIGIFGPTTKSLGFFPYGQKHSVVEVDLPCRPCGLHGGRQCPKKHFNCMRLITVQMVFNEIMRKL